MFVSIKRGTAALALLMAGLTLGGCDRDSVLEPTEESDILYRAAPADAGLVTVMTRNLFVGAPVEMIYAPGANIPDAAAQLWAWVQSTDFEERADAIADEIATAQPHAIGLQEVSIFNIFTNFDGTSFDPVPVQSLNFLEVLLAKLAERGLTYWPVSNSENFQGAVPMFLEGSPTGLGLIALADFDVILVRDDVTWSNPQNANFNRNLIVPLMGQYLEILRGWASVDLNVEGLDFRFVTTHLEPEHPDPTVQVDQGNEVIAALTNWTLPGDPDLPTILTGDMNSAADGSDTPTYGNFIAADFEDAWTQEGIGYTCCQDESLRIYPSQLVRRVDVILMRGDFGLLEPGINGAVHAKIFGDKISDLTLSGLWPSDHAGVYADIMLPRTPLAE